MRIYSLTNINVVFFLLLQLVVWIINLLSLLQPKDAQQRMRAALMIASRSMMGGTLLLLIRCKLFPLQFLLCFFFTCFIHTHTNTHELVYYNNAQQQHAFIHQPFSRRMCRTEIFYVFFAYGVYVRRQHTDFVVVAVFYTLRKKLIKF